MLASFAAKTFAAWTFRLIWGVAGVIPTGWIRRPVEFYVRDIQTDVIITKAETDRAVLL